MTDGRSTIASRLGRHVVEPVRVHGGVVLAPRLYSPLRWAQRDPDAPVLSVPDEEERIRRFGEASRQYIVAILLRLAELREPGRELDGRDRKQVERLADVLHAIAEALGAVRKRTQAD